MSGQAEPAGTVVQPQSGASESRNPAGGNQAPRPNVIWLVADQWRAQAVGANGDPNVRTPNVDRLCTMGVNFSQARSGFPLCSPFRGSMLTGRYPHHTVPGHECRLPAGQETIAHVFNRAGYHTSYFGKWHVDGFEEKYGRAALHIIPPERRGGFATWVGYENNGSPWDSWVHGGSGKDAFHYRLNGYEADVLTDLFIEHLSERAADKKDEEVKPFFAVLSIHPPHNPYVAPAGYMAHYNAANLTLRPNVPLHARLRAVEDPGSLWSRDGSLVSDVPAVLGTALHGRTMSIDEMARLELAGYYAQIENWDWNVGRVLDALARYGLSFNTHVMVFSDHGDMHGSHGHFRKTTPYEEAVRIPMVVSGETALYDQRLTGRPGTLFSQVDIAPTTLGLCGLEAPDWMEGRSYSGHRLGFQDPPAEADSVYLQQIIPPAGNPYCIYRPLRGLVTSDGWKYVCFENQTWLMFNLVEDPYEQVNVAFSYGYRKERARLISRLKQWVSDTGDQFTVPED